MRTCMHSTILCVILCRIVVCRWNGGGTSGEEDIVGVDRGCHILWVVQLLVAATMSSRRKCSDEMIRLSVARHCVLAKYFPEHCFGTHCFKNNA